MIRSLVVVFAVLTVALGGCGSATVSGDRQVGAAPTAPPSIVYVADFGFTDARAWK